MPHQTSAHPKRKCIFNYWIFTSEIYELSGRFADMYKYLGPTVMIKGDIVALNQMHIFISYQFSFRNNKQNGEGVRIADLSIFLTKK
jgi:hypothetical protein